MTCCSVSFIAGNFYLTTSNGGLSNISKKVISQRNILCLVCILSSYSEVILSWTYSSHASDLAQLLLGRYEWQLVLVSLRHRHNTCHASRCFLVPSWTLPPSAWGWQVQILLTPHSYKNISGRKTVSQVTRPHFVNSDLHEEEYQVQKKSHVSSPIFSVIFFINIFFSSATTNYQLAIGKSVLLTLQTQRPVKLRRATASLEKLRTERIWKT